MPAAYRIVICLIALLLVSPATADTKPNIVFMLSDDQSWSGTAVPMHPDHDFSFDEDLHTPHLQGMAARGMRFSSAYAPAPVCSPTRASLITGRSPAALGWTKAGPSLAARKNPPMLAPQSDRSLDSGIVTFAELLQDAGYRTAHLGKWHLGGGGPEANGFDVSDGNIGNEASAKYKAPNPVDLFGMAKRAEAFMAESKQAGKPFFIQLSWLALHSAENALPETIKKYRNAGLRRDRQAQRAALTENMDTAVGRVIASIDKLGLTDNTYIIFMSDNGGPSRDSLAGGKGNLFEGGIRVPLVITGPGIKADSWSHTPVVGYDFYPTFLDLAGVEIPEAVQAKLEGGSITKVLSGQADNVDRQREGLIFHFPHYQTQVTPHSAIRVGDYKLLKSHQTGKVKLFNLEADLREKNDLSKSQPDLARELEAKLDAALQELGAALPIVNSDYDPSKPTETSVGPTRDRR
ncbi:MAG: sulfatase [Planctomycetota bacterium]